LLFNWRKKKKKFARAKSKKKKRKNPTFFTNKQKKRKYHEGNDETIFSLLADVKRTTTAVSSTTRDYNCDLLLPLERKKKFLLGFFPRNRSLYYQSLEKSLESFLCINSKRIAQLE